MGQTKCPYYEYFLQIHDLPVNHVQPANDLIRDAYYENEEGNTHP